MAQSETTPPAPSKEHYVKIIALTVLAMLAITVVMDKFAGSRRTSDYDARAKRSEALLTAGQERDKKYDDYYRRIDEDQKRNRALLDRREQNDARFEKILSTWEQQQKEYQSYLDSLKHSHE
jgi:hypothetical protein